MSNFAPIWLNFNGGEVSDKLYSRVDHDKYSSWLETCVNFILTPQGMATKRPGSIFTGACESPDFASEIVPFEYSEEENYILEFTKDGWIRFYTNDGLVLESSKSGTVTSTTTITSAAHGFLTGDYVYLSGMASSNHNGKVVKLSGVTANTFTFTGYDLDVSSGAVTAARVYRIEHPYAQADLANIQWCQSGNTLYLFHKDYQTRTLVRDGNTDWTLTTHNFENGPWLPVNAGETHLSLSASGDLGRKAGVTVTASAGTAANAVDGNPSVNWQATAASEWVQIDLGAGNTAKLRSYVLFSGDNNPELAAPGAWQIQGSNDGATWTTIEAGHATEAWLPTEGKFFPLRSTKAYRYFRLFVDTSWDDDNFIRVGWWGLLADPDAGGSTLTLTADNVLDINGGAGFSANDVGRAIRLLTTRGYWVWAKITAYTSSTVVSVQLQDFPLGADFANIRAFQLGVFSSATRWPDAGDFFQNRLAVTGGQPIRVTASETDNYTNYASSDQEGVTTASDALNVVATSRKGDGANWIASTNRGILAGTRSGEWLVGAASTDRTVSSDNVSSDEVTKYGSRVGVRPVNTGSAVLFMDKTGTALRELAYVFDQDGYRAPSLNLLADHIFEGSPCVALAYQGSPHSLVWACRADGELRALTYNRENDIVGWHRHELGGGGLVKKVVSVTNTAGDADDVYMVVEREIDGQTVHYIERLAPTFKKGTAQEDAFFVDCGATYDGSAATVIHNLWHLEGEEVVALADGVIMTGLTVENGQLTLPRAASVVQIGYSYTSTLKTLPLRGGAMDGTAHGRLKRHYQVIFDLWRTFGGKFGPTEDEDALETINFVDSFTQQNGVAPPLFTGFKGPFAWPGGHERPGAVCYVHEDPTPCNIRAFMPRNDLTDA